MTKTGVGVTSQEAHKLASSMVHNILDAKTNPSSCSASAVETPAKTPSSEAKATPPPTKNVIPGKMVNFQSNSPPDTKPIKEELKELDNVLGIDDQAPHYLDPYGLLKPPPHCEFKNLKEFDKFVEQNYGHKPWDAVKTPFVSAPRHSPAERLPVNKFSGVRQGSKINSKVMNDIPDQEFVWGSEFLTQHAPSAPPSVFGESDHIPPLANVPSSVKDYIHDYQQEISNANQAQYKRDRNRWHQFEPSMMHPRPPHKPVFSDIPLLDSIGREFKSQAIEGSAIQFLRKQVNFDKAAMHNSPSTVAVDSDPSPVYNIRQPSTPPQAFAFGYESRSFKDQSVYEREQHLNHIRKLRQQMSSF